MKAYTVVEKEEECPLCCYVTQELSYEKGKKLETKRENKKQFDGSGNAIK